jgi:hypothetical protein
MEHSTTMGTVILIGSILLVGILVGFLLAYLIKKTKD